MSHHFKNKLNPTQPSFLKIKTSTNNLVTCLDSIYLVDSFQRQVDSI